ncbi:MAG: hypothetical protein HY518_00940, partial [Candidatus Aenigmarchaeota archaeon]|nr:hypothetical protein [Candidatus Aenigmarchaeota archaeon]
GGRACNCTDWTNVEPIAFACGVSSCSPTQVFQTRTCNPAACRNETQCVENPVCLETIGFAFNTSVSEAVIPQGEDQNIIGTIENTGRIPIQFSVGVDRECCDVSVSETQNGTFVPLNTSLLDNNESKDISIGIHVPLNQTPGTYLVTVNVSARIPTGQRVNTKNIIVIVAANGLIQSVADLGAALADLDSRIAENKAAGVDVGQLESEAENIRQLLGLASESIKADKLADLKSMVSLSEHSIRLANEKLAGLGLVRLVVENRFYIIAGIILVVVLSYLTSQIAVPYYRMGKDLKALEKEEKALVSTRIDTEHQYFSRRIDEKMFNSMMMEAQGKVLKARATLRQREEDRRLLVRSKLTPKAVINWLKGIRRMGKRKQIK